MVCCQSILCGDASTNRLPGISPAGYASHTGYQYDSISRVAGHRELAPPSKFSKLGGFNSTVFMTSDIHHPQRKLILGPSPARAVVRIQEPYPYQQERTGTLQYSVYRDLHNSPNNEISFVFHTII